MELVQASIQKLQTETGEEVEYARLMYRTRTGVLGQSVLLGRLSAETLRLARLDYRAGS